MTAKYSGYMVLVIWYLVCATGTIVPWTKLDCMYIHGGSQVDSNAV